MEPSPLSIDELLEHCISYLRNSPRDLIACALVSRLWVFAAQSLLFRTPPTFDNRSSGIHGTWSRLFQTLETSPHLTRHVRHLDINIEIIPKTSGAALSRICHFPFTHVQSVTLVYVDRAPDGLADLQQLFSLPALLDVYLLYLSIERGEFIRLWERASPTIRHVRLCCGELTSVTAPPAATHLPSPETPIVLDSLHIESIGALDYRWMMQPCPFDLSHLKVLCVGSNVEVSWQDFSPAVQTIKCLDICLNPRNANTPHLSSFPNLSFLHISLIFPSEMPQVKALDLAEQFFSGVSPTSVIRTITISLDLGRGPSGSTQLEDSVACERLDSVLSGLALPRLPIVELEVDAQVYESVRPYFHRLSSRDVLRRTDRYGRRWYERP
ncbi:hypothetical protein DFH06DRAFT_1241943 [Mycena polygramma]|nr:hypothetical protein DFH06DRAFT_1241943 [Mycena polygramma]